MTRGRHQILVGDVRQTLQQIDAGTIQTAVTSPPYWKQRSYLPADHVNKSLELGSELTPEQFITNQVEVFRGVRRALHDTGTLFINIGDSYADDTKWGGSTGGKHVNGLHGKSGPGRLKVMTGMKAGDQCTIPHRLAMALRDDGWFLRSTIIWCLSGGTTVYARTQRGDRPITIKDLTRLKPDSVKLWNGEKWTRVLGWSRNSRNSDELEIVIRSGERISCTTTHKFPTTRGLLTASEIKVGDELKRVVLPEPSSPKNPEHIGNDAAWLAGLYIAEGSQHGDNDSKIRIAGHAKEIERFEKVKRIAESYGGSAVCSVDGNNQTISLHGRLLIAIINELVSGRTAKDKCLSPKCWQYSNSFLQAMLDGYLSGDGHWDSENKRWRLGFTRNYNLERDLRVVAARLNFSLTMNLSTVKFDDKSWKAFRGEIRFESTEHHNSKSREEVVEIRKARCREVYDIGVEDEPHLFALSSGILTHNSKPGPTPESVSGWRWVKCRVKIAPSDRSTEKKAVTSNGKPHGARSNNGRDFESEAKWEPCPGCDKCFLNGGLRLRKGRWRPTGSFEYVFMFSKSDIYFCDGDAVAELAVGGRPGNKKAAKAAEAYRNGDVMQRTKLSLGTCDARETRNPRAVWTISSEGTKIKHFAAYPSELVRRIILAATSEAGCCPACRIPYAPIVEKQRVPTRPGLTNKIWKATESGDRTQQRSDLAPNLDPQRHVAITKILGHRPCCGCAAGEPIASIVLDPYCGIGTTGQVATWYDRDFVGCELYEKYAELADKRIQTMPRCMAKLLKQKKARPVQTSGLFDDLA